MRHVIPQHKEPSTHQRFLKVIDVARYMSMKKETIQSWLDRGVLKRKHGMIDTADVMALINAKKASIGYGEIGQDGQITESAEEEQERLDKEDIELAKKIANNTFNAETIAEDTARLLRAKRELAELKVKEQVNQLLQQQDVIDAINKFSVLLVSKLTGMVNKVAVLADGQNSNQIRDILNRELHLVVDEVREQASRIEIRFAEKDF